MHLHRDPNKKTSVSKKKVAVTKSLDIYLNMEILPRYTKVFMFVSIFVNFLSDTM